MTVAVLTPPAWLDELQALITNRLDPEALRGRRIAAILGDVPSTYAKSPKLWNAAFRALSLPAAYVPLDIPREHLAQALKVLRGSEAFLGGSVTVPYKMDVLPLLDEVDPLTARIGAVNAIVRAPHGRLVGYNTDGLGGLRALTESILPGDTPRISDLASARALLIGAGGAAQAVAFFLWQRMTAGELTIVNRSRAGADALAARLRTFRDGRVRVVDEAAIPSCLPEANLVINATVKGQAGIRKLADGRWTCLEPYSALAPAHPAALAPAEQSTPAFFAEWLAASRADIQRNHDASLQACAKLPRDAVCYDLIYAPLETTFLRHARWSGAVTLNGKTMNLVQAAEAFMRYVCRDWLAEQGLDTPQTFQRVFHAMAEEWAE